MLESMSVCTRKGFIRIVRRATVGLLGLVLLGSGPSQASSASQNANPYRKMYWVDRWKAKVQRANLDGSQVEDLVITGLEEPTDLALDLNTGKMYWSDRLTGKIQRANLDGSGIEDLVTGRSDIWSLALDLAGGKIYWASSSWRRPGILRSNLDGSHIEELVTTGFRTPKGLALDVAGHKMYWTDENTNKIQRANLDGSNVEDLITSGLGGPWGLALDLAKGNMYWADWTTHKIQRANLDGSKVEDLITRPDNTAAVVLVPSVGRMYWTEGEWSPVSMGRILRANLDGSEVEVLVSSGLQVPKGLALAGVPTAAELNRPPKLENIESRRAAQGDLLRIALAVRDPDGDRITFEAKSDHPEVATVSTFAAGVHVRALSPGTTTVTVTATDSYGAAASQAFAVEVTPPPPPKITGKIYWTDPGAKKIRRANLDGSQAEDLVTRGLDYPSGLALDTAGEKIYWTDPGNRRIQRANLDGSRVENLVTTGLIDPQGLALDLAGGKIYWTDSGTNRVQRANLDGSRVESLVTIGLHSPEGLALAGGKIYWTDYGTDKIQRANLDGSNVQDLVTGLISPQGLALDLAGGKVYWTDFGSDKIQRANLDGSDIQDLVSLDLKVPRGLALAGGKIYWTDYGTDKIQRADLDGSNVEVLLTGLGDPLGLALDIDHVTMVEAPAPGTGAENLTEVRATVLGAQAGGVTVEFARAVSGIQPPFIWSATTDAAGRLELLISASGRVSGYYQAQARNQAGELVGRWNSIPLNANRRQILELTLGGGMRVLAVEHLDIAREGGQEGLPAGVIAYYPLNGDARDASGNGFHGTMSGPGTARDRFGNQGGAVLFNGSHHLIDLPHTVLDGKFDVTIAFWLKTLKAEGQAIVSGANRVNDNEHIVYFSSESQIRFYSHGRVGVGGRSECNVDIQPIADDTWHHFAVVRNASQGNADFFIDGLGYFDRCGHLDYNALVIDAGGLILGQEQDRLGGGFDASQVLKGALDELGFFNRALSAAEVRSLMNSRGPRIFAASKDVSKGVSEATSRLYPNIPNPFNATTRISYRLASSGPVRLEVFNTLGQPVRTLVDQIQDAGTHQKHWDARDQHGARVAAGVYLLLMRHPGGVQTRPLLYIK